MNPLRIKRLTLTDFRAFPGPTPAHFDFDGKNLLVYGENGAGKSSIFHALREFFSLKPRQSLADYKNVFSGEPESSCKVNVEYVGDTVPVEWSMDKHPCERDRNVPVADWYSYFFGNSDSRTISTALRCACLDYRALLDTNYLHGDRDINLFGIALERLLSDYPVIVSGGQTRALWQLWADVEKASQAKPRAPRPGATPSAATQRILAACALFNTGFRQALDALHPHAQTLLGELVGTDVVIAPFSFNGLTYSTGHFKRDREIVGRELKLDVTFRNFRPARPQHFLNEARLSALAMSIYLAGRLACTPTATTDALKLLVLDDVLIGLDHSNRLPILDVLHTHFPDWQVVLLTHDKTWFDLARERLPKNNWVCCEIYEGDPAATAPIPIVRPTMNRPAKALLQKAGDLLNLGYVEAAANYARQAFESGMRGACEWKKIKLSYRQDSSAYQAQDFLDALREWKVAGSLKQADWDAAIHRLELLKNVVLNPYSHPSAPNIPKQEVVDAIAAVTTFLDLVAKK